MQTATAMMEVTPEENYIISAAKKAYETDPFAAKAWILTAKTLYPNNFKLQFEAYKVEKAAKNFEEAAKCFSYIILTFQKQPVELWTEVSELTAALRVPEGETNEHQDFYVKMFQHVSHEVQHKILLLTANHSENTLDHCKLILLLLKRFPQAITTHSARLLEAIVQGMPASPTKFQEMLIQEALPLLFHKTPDLPSPLVYKIFTISFEYYMKQMFEEKFDNKASINDIWKQIFQVLGLCTKILNWEPFLPYNKNWSKDVYCQKLFQIVASHPPRAGDNKPILFYATTLFVLSLQEYIANIKQKIDDTEVEFLFVEGFRELMGENIQKPMSAIEISICPPCSPETSVAFVTAANCWPLLNANELQKDFSQLLMKLPLSPWINRFLFDLAVYCGHHEEARQLLQEMKVTGLRHSIRLLVLNLMQGPITAQNFDSVVKVIGELPIAPGNLVDEISVMYKQRHLIMLPLTQKAVLQYCTKAILNSLRRKIYENSLDLVLGDILVLLQVDFPRESILAEQIFAIIKSKRQFSYLLFKTYIICIDFLEEFMHLWNSGEFNLEFASTQTSTNTRRIGTRGADKGVKEDFKQVMKQQVARSNDDIFALVTQFITQEYSHLQNFL